MSATLADHPAARKLGSLRTLESTFMRRSPIPSLILVKYDVRSCHIRKLHICQTTRTKTLTYYMVALTQRSIERKHRANLARCTTKEQDQGGTYSSFWSSDIAKLHSTAFEARPTWL